MAKVNLMSLAEYARHRGCSKVAVTKAVQAERISLIDGKVDPTVADLQWKQNTRARVGAAPPRPESPDPAAVLGDLEGTTGGADDYWVSRARREAAEAELAELKLAEQNGEVIRVAAVSVVWSAALAGTREHLLQVRARLAPLLAVESDVFKIEQLLDLEHSQALQLLASGQVKQAGVAG